MCFYKRKLYLQNFLLFQKLSVQTIFRKMPSFVAILESALTLVAVLGACAANVPACPGGHYLSRAHRECRKCDACPPNEIIRKPCSEDSNTMCRPFFEFHQFHQAPRPSVDLQDLPFSHDDDDSEGASEDGIDWPDGAAFDYLSNLDDESSRHSNNAREKHGKGQHRHSGRHKGKTTETGHPVGDAVSSRVQGSGHSECGGETGGQAPSVHNTETCDSYWKITSLCLIGVLGIVCVFLIVFIFVVCHLQNRRGYLKKVLYSVGESTRVIVQNCE